MMEDCFGGSPSYSHEGINVTNYFIYFGRSLDAGGGWTMGDEAREIILKDFSLRNN